MRLTWAFIFLWVLMLHIDFGKSSHLRSGIILWRALNTSGSGSSVDVIIRQRYAWRRSFQSGLPDYPCNDSAIGTRLSYSVIGNFNDMLNCVGGSSCSVFNNTSFTVGCTDFSVAIDYQLCEGMFIRTLPINKTFVLNYYGNAWINLVTGGNGPWSVTSTINLNVRPDGKINSPPIAVVLPVVYRLLNRRYTQVIHVADPDLGDIVRCRWSSQNVTGNFNGYDECGTVCAPSLPPGYILFQNNCTVVFNVTTSGLYAMALQVEDYLTPNSSTPMSSTPVQFVVYATGSSGSCSSSPTVRSRLVNGGCLGTPIGILMQERIYADIGCGGKNISEFVTSSPLGMTKGTMRNSSNGTFSVEFSWTPTADQYGPQGFCLGVIDNTMVQSDSWCLTFLVGVSAPTLQSPNLIPGSGFPINSVETNHSVFYIKSANGQSITRPRRAGVFVHFHDVSQGNSIVLEYDCFSSSNLSYINDTLYIDTAPYVWTPGSEYFITFDQGAASSIEFCGAESAQIQNPNFWSFNVSFPPTTTTTTTTETTTTATTSTTTTTTSVSTTTTSSSTTTSTTASTTTSTGVTESESEKKDEQGQVIGLAVGVTLGCLASIALAIGSGFLIRKCLSNKNVVESIMESETSINTETSVPSNDLVVENVESMPVP